METSRAVTTTLVDSALQTLVLIPPIETIAMKKTILALGCAAAMFGTSCIGPNNAFNSINNWNGTVTTSKWLNELIFIVAWIVPVYPIAWIGDVLLFNSVEFWGGEPLIEHPGTFALPE